MHRTKLREDKKCQNCGRFVAERFCPHCGQENVETRLPFYHLFTHFITDFIHYDSRFWRTIRDLYRPAKLTQAYLSGKRTSYASPFHLYIFISFLVFFIPAVLPDMNKTDNKNKNQNKELTVEDIDEAITDIKYDFNIGRKNENNKEDETPAITVKTKNEKLDKRLKDKFSKKGAIQEMLDTVAHHFPKAIFLYMPVFALWLWIFHSKKKWMYFDHGIYTLHYFSFLLLTILLYIIVDWLLSIFQRDVSDWITLAVLCYFLYYFFHSHRLMYQESKASSRTKCALLVIINTLCMSIFFACYFVLIILVF